MQHFLIFLLQRNLLQIFALVMEPYVMIKVSILLSVINPTDKNVASMFCFHVSAELLAAICGTLRLRGTLVEKQ